MTAQLDLFAPISPTKSVNVGVMGEGVTQNVSEGQKVVFYWQKFLPTVKKLHEERQTGKNTTGGYNCPDWWKSRFSDFLTNTNTQPKNHEEWVYRTIGYNLFDLIWSKYGDLMRTY
jgi:hypothetical protein